MDGSSPHASHEAPAPRSEPTPGMTRPGKAAPGLIAPDRAPEIGPDRPAWPAIRRGLARRCPHCGEGHLFDGYLKVARVCPSCGEELFHHRADDGPAYLTILIVGHIVGFAMHFAWVQFRPDPLLFATTLTVLAVALSLWMLPRLKGAIVGYQWAKQMGGFGRGDAASD